MFKSKTFTLFTVIILAVAMSVFVYSNTYAQDEDPGEDLCKICAGQEEPVEDQDCVDVTVDGYEGCLEWYDGQCDNVGEDCDV